MPITKTEFKVIESVPMGHGLHMIIVDVPKECVLPAVTPSVAVPRISQSLTSGITYKDLGINEVITTYCMWKLTASGGGRYATRYLQDGSDRAQVTFYPPNVRDNINFGGSGQLDIFVPFGPQLGGLKVVGLSAEAHDAGHTGTHNWDNGQLHLVAEVGDYIYGTGDTLGKITGLTNANAVSGNFTVSTGLNLDLANDAALSVVIGDFYDNCQGARLCIIGRKG